MPSGDDDDDGPSASLARRSSLRRTSPYASVVAPRRLASEPSSSSCVPLVLPSSYAFDDLFAEQALGADQQKCEGEDVGEPVFDGAADEGAPVDLAEFFADADDEAADDGAGDGLEAAEDEDGERLEGDERQAELHAALGAPHDAGHDRHDPRHRPHDHPDG